jgi:hypothetical protein
MVNVQSAKPSEASTQPDRGLSHHGSPIAAAERAMGRFTSVVSLPVLGEVRLPSPIHLGWYAGVVALVAIEVIEWPIGLLIAAGKVLADNHHNAVLREFGEALESEG